MIVIRYNINYALTKQGSYRSWKTWKVMELKLLFVLESDGKLKLILLD